MSPGPWELFAEIEKLDLHLQEPRFECQMRAHYIGEFLWRKHRIEPCRFWALSHESYGRLLCPLRDEHGNPFPDAVTDVDAAGNLIVAEEDGQPLRWKWHVTAGDGRDRYNPILYDPVMFNGPTTHHRWMAVFGKVTPPIFVRTDWSTGPKYNWQGSAYTPDYQHEHGPDERMQAAMDLRSVKARSPKGVRYQRYSPSWR